MWTKFANKKEIQQREKLQVKMNGNRVSYSDEWWDTGVIYHIMLLYTYNKEINILSCRTLLWCEQ